MSRALEIIEYFKHGKMHPNEIFDIYDELSNLPDEEVKDAVRKSRVGDAIEMSYITAIEMQKNGKWNAYLENWEKDKDKTDMDRLEEYMREHGLKKEGA